MLHLWIFLSRMPVTLVYSLERNECLYAILEFYLYGHNSLPMLMAFLLHL